MSVGERMARSVRAYRRALLPPRLRAPFEAVFAAQATDGGALLAVELARRVLTQQQAQLVAARLRRAQHVGGRRVALGALAVPVVDLAHARARGIGQGQLLERF